MMTETRGLQPSRGPWRSERRRRKPGKVVAVWMACMGLVLPAGGCGEEETAPEASPPLLETGADMVMTDIKLNITMENVREGELFADTAFMFRDSSVYHLRNPEMVLFTEQGAQRARVTAERGRFNPNTRGMLANGNVILVITEGNKRVESQELNYDPNGDRIWSDSATTMVEPGRVSEGLGFESDLNFRRTVVGPGSIRNTGGGGSPVVGDTVVGDTVVGDTVVVDSVEGDTVRGGAGDGGGPVS